MILTKSVTRFARNTLDSIKAIRELKSLGIAVYFEKERVNTLMEKSEQMITILSSIAQENPRIHLPIANGQQYGGFRTAPLSLVARPMDMKTMRTGNW